MHGLLAESPGSILNPIIDHATEMAGGRKDAMQWLRTPIDEFDFAAPMSLHAIKEGQMRANDILGQMNTLRHRPTAPLALCRYHRAIVSRDFFDDDFIAAVQTAGGRARIETLKAGVPVFYWDAERNPDVIEQPDGRKFEIRFLPGQPRDRNYTILRELDETAA